MHDTSILLFGSLTSSSACNVYIHMLSREKVPMVQEIKYRSLPNSYISVFVSKPPRRCSLFYFQGQSLLHISVG